MDIRFRSIQPPGINTFIIQLIVQQGPKKLFVPAQVESIIKSRGISFLPIQSRRFPGNIPFEEPAILIKGLTNRQAFIELRPYGDHETYMVFIMQGFDHTGRIGKAGCCQTPDCPSHSLSSTTSRAQLLSSGIFLLRNSLTVLSISSGVLYRSRLCQRPMAHLGRMELLPVISPVTSDHLIQVLTLDKIIIQLAARLSIKCELLLKITLQRA